MIQVKTTLDFALDYARFGWPVFPCHTAREGRCSCGKEDCSSPAKHPMTANGLKDATVEPDTIRAWWTRWPEANIAYALPESYAVVDVDVSNGKKGADTLATLEAEFGNLPETIRSRTGGGGTHYFFVPREKLKNNNTTLLDVDLKTHGGYVLLPPSRHISGGEYRWENSPEDTSVTFLPDWLTDIYTGRITPGNAPAVMKQEVHKTPVRSGSPLPPPQRAYEGMRNDTMFRLASSLRAKGLSQASLEAALLAENKARCEPPLSEREILTIARSAGKYEQGEVQPVQYMDILTKLHPVKNNRYAWSDIGNGRLFADLFKERARYVPERNMWFIYNGRRWTEDVGNLKAMELCKRMSDGLLSYAWGIEDEKLRAEYLAFVAKLQKRSVRETILRDAASVFPVSVLEFDKNPMVLNLLNGTLDFNTGEFTPHRAEDFLSKLAHVHYDGGARCERWESFIMEVMHGDAEKALFLQKALGYALTGATWLECFFILYGPTSRNGKGTLMETFRRMLGDYGRSARPDTIAQKQAANGNGPSEDIARLAGARFVNVSEPDKKMILSSALVKTLTGNDSITARYLRENSFEFIPQFKLFINTNHLPSVTDTTVFSSGRVKIIPFTRHFAEHERDVGLKAELARPENLSGVLNWCLQGLRLLMAEGLTPPDSVRDATEEYRMSSDKIGRFLLDECEKGPGFEMTTSDAYTRYQIWCGRNGHQAENVQNFKSLLSSHTSVQYRRPFGASRQANKKTFADGYRLLNNSYESYGSTGNF